MIEVTKTHQLRRSDLVHPELSYLIIGILFNVYNELGFGHLERVYQRAVAKALKDANVRFVEQVFTPVSFQGENVGKYFLDFLIEDKVVLELKQGGHFSRGCLDQVNAYLKSTGCQLAILANFTSDKVSFRRLVNIIHKTT